jgi:hypothetical protein
VLFKSRAGNATFTARFSVSNTIIVAVKAFGNRTIPEGATYPHNKNYNFRIVVNVTHPDGRPYNNTSITVYIKERPQGS